MKSINWSDKAGNDCANNVSAKLICIINYHLPIHHGLSRLKIGANESLVIGKIQIMAPPLKQPIKENWQIDQGAIGEIQNSQSSMRHSIRITTEFEIQKGRHNSKKKQKQAAISIWIRFKYQKWQSTTKQNIYRSTWGNYMTGAILSLWTGGDGQRWLRTTGTTFISHKRVPETFARKHTTRHNK